jgi:hypothetical protein
MLLPSHLTESYTPYSSENLPVPTHKMGEVMMVRREVMMVRRMMMRRV